MKEGFKHWVSVKLTNPVIDGTVTTVTGLTMPTFAVGSSDGIDYNPGSDIDADIITVGVTGSPKIFWDESDDRFALTHGLRIDRAVTSQPRINLHSAPVVGAGAAHGASVQFFYERTNPELYDTIGYFYFYELNSVGAQTDMGELKLMNVLNTAGTEYARWVIAATYNGTLTTLASWDAGNGLTIQTDIKFGGSGLTIATLNTDVATLLFKARDTGVGLVEVAKLVGAADPYWQFTLDCVFYPKAQPAAPVEGMVIYNTATNKLQVYTGAGWETIVSA